MAITNLPGVTHENGVRAGRRQLPSLSDWLSLRYVALQLRVGNLATQEEKDCSEETLPVGRLRFLRQWMAYQGNGLKKVLLVTGSAGSIDSEICRQLLSFSPRRLIALDPSENGQFFLEEELRALGPEAEINVVLADLNDRKRIHQVFQQFRPEIVFHAAAYKHVPLMEAHPGEAVKNIIASLQSIVPQYQADATPIHPRFRTISKPRIECTSDRAKEAA